MTAEEKAVLAGFTGLVSDYLKDGHARNGYSIKDSEEYGSAAGEASAPALPSGPLPDGEAESPALPLAYTVEEPPENPGGGYVEEIGTDSAALSSLGELAAAVQACTACGLSAGRNKAVPGEGVPHPLVMVIGEGPGADEDVTGRPFTGRAGQLLDRMLASIGLSRNTNCYIANIVKCRPPGNRDPEPEETAACIPFLEKQISLLKPRVILCAGRVAAQNLLKTDKGINSLRGEFSGYRIRPAAGDGDTGAGAIIPVLCTFHPSAILRDGGLKRPAWEDLKLLKSKTASLDPGAAAPGEI